MMLRSASLIAVLGAALWTQAAAETIRDTGICEASAAARIGPDVYLVASDENDALTLYRRGEPKPLVQTAIELGEIDDIEAATHIGPIQFWLTSHSLTRKGKDRDERRILLATSVDGDGVLRTIGVPYRNIRADVARLIDESESDLEEQFDIEGVAADADGSLLIGLRAPLTDTGRAYVARIERPFDLLGIAGAAPTGSPLVTLPVSELDLGGRGIRDMERAGTGAHAFLILAGPSRDDGPRPALFWWDGTGQPTPGPDVDFGGMEKPEALIVWSETEALVLGDNDLPVPKGEERACDEGGLPEAERWHPGIEVRF